METKLKVGDKVYKLYYNPYGEYSVSHSFSIVDRVTPTRAYLKNGKTLTNKYKHWFPEYWTGAYDPNRWNIVTEEIMNEYRESERRREIDIWFRNYKFSEDEKEKIFLLLNPK